MRQTEKLGLWLPEDTDPLEVSRLSENFEKLDPLGSGVEAVKNGMGAGSLFQVSKYYKEPIKDALLCNGGSAQVQAYPELYDVLGTIYGGTMGYDNVDSRYGITSALGYPTAYNRDRDLFVAAETTQLILYRKGAAPERTVSLTAVITGYQPSKINLVLSAGRYVFVVYTYSYSGSTNAAGDAVYDLDSGAWAKLSALSAVAARLPATILNWTSALGARPCRQVVETDDYLYSIGSNYAIRGYEIDQIDKKDISKSSAVVALDASLVSTTYTVTFQTVLTNYDAPDDGKIYVLAATSQPAFVLLCVDMQSGPEPTVSVVTTASAAINYNAPHVGALIVGGYCYVKCAASSGLNINLYRFKLTGGSASIYLSAIDTTATATTASGATAGMQAVRLSNTDAVLFVNDLKKTLFVSSETTGKAETCAFSACSIIQQAPGDPLATSVGAVANFGVKNFGLPTITQSEALVYIRTKGVD